MGARIGHAAEVLLRLDIVLLEHEVTRHQAARGGRNGTEGKRLALQVGQAFHVGVGGDELGRELGVLLTLYQWRGGRVLQVHLNEREAPQPGQVETVCGQRLHHRRVVGHGYELHLHAQLLGQVFTQRLELALQLGRRFVGDGADTQGFGGLNDSGTARQHEAGGKRQGAVEHGCSPVQ
ncbi:hypothetical protein D9M71_572350 [compost metagenome]